MPRPLFVMLALFAGLLPALCFAAPLNEAAFRDEMKQRLEARLKGAKLAPVADEPLSLHLAAGDDHDEMTFNLQRIFGYCQNANV